MLGWLHARKLVVSCVAAFVVGALFIILSQSFQSCVQANHFENTDSTSPESLLQVAGTWYWCAGIFFTENGIAITALATIVMAAFTGTLWRATTAQGRLTQQSIDLARDEFVATHRPLIRVRFISPPVERDGETVFGLTIANVGESTATLLECSIMAATREDGSIEANGIELLPMLENLPFKLVAGQRHIFVSTLVRTWDEYDDRAHVAGTVIFEVSGRFQYADDAGIMRQTSFSRQCIGHTGSFRISNINPEDDYED